MKLIAISALLATVSSVSFHRIENYSNLELNSKLEARHLTDMRAKVDMKMMDKVNDNIAKLEAIVDDKEDPDWKSMALGMITRL